MLHLITHSTVHSTVHTILYPNPSSHIDVFHTLCEDVQGTLLHHSPKHETVCKSFCYPSPLFPGKLIDILILKNTTPCHSRSSCYSAGFITILYSSPHHPFLTTRDDNISKLFSNCDVSVATFWALNLF